MGTRVVCFGRGDGVIEVSCWSHRGCDPAMQADCPHAIDPSEKCPVSCYYATCDRPTHRVTGDPALVFDPSIDRSAAAKELCTHCVHFLTTGPRL